MMVFKVTRAILSILVSTVIMSVVTSCRDISPTDSLLDEHESEQQVTMGIVGEIGDTSPAYSNLQIVVGHNSSEIQDDGTFSIVIPAETTQILQVVDSNNDPVLLSIETGDEDSNGTIIDARSTAISLAFIDPYFSTATIEESLEFEDIVTQQSSFNELVEYIEERLNEGTFIITEEDEVLLGYVSSLYRDIESYFASVRNQTTNLNISRSVMPGINIEVNDIAVTDYTDDRITIANRAPRWISIYRESYPEDGSGLVSEFVDIVPSAEISFFSLAKGDGLFTDETLVFDVNLAGNEYVHIKCYGPGNSDSNLPSEEVYRILGPMAYTLFFDAVLPMIEMFIGADLQPNNLIDVSPDDYVHVFLSTFIDNFFNNTANLGLFEYIYREPDFSSISPDILKSLVEAVFENPYQVVKILEDLGFEDALLFEDSLAEQCYYISFALRAREALEVGATLGSVWALQPVTTFSFRPEPVEYSSDLIPGTWYSAGIEDSYEFAMDIDQVGNGAFSTISFSYRDTYEEGQYSWYSDNSFTLDMIIADQYSSDTFRGIIEADSQGENPIYPELVFTSQSSFQLTLYSDPDYTEILLSDDEEVSAIYSFTKSFDSLGLPEVITDHIPGELTNLSISNATTDSLYVSWDSTANATKYLIERWNLDTWESEMVGILGNVTSFLDTNLDSDIQYEYFVHAGNSYGWGGYDYEIGRTLLPNETISTPYISLRPNELEIGESGVFTASTTIESNLDHPLEYRFDWGDGTYSDWSTSRSASHSWDSKGSKSIRLQVRCAIHSSIVNESSVYEVPVFSQSTITSYNDSGVDDFPILDNEQVSSSVGIVGPFPTGSEISEARVYYEIRHSHPEDLTIWITAYYDNAWHDFILFDSDSSLEDNVDLEESNENIYEWNGISPNQTWYLSVQDNNIDGHEGYIDFFQIWIDYKSY